jgi:pyruvate dehydrogenase E2 component (dihydrolipoamide acetyltransferase)
VARVLRMPGVASDAHQGVLSSWLIDETDAFDAAQTIAYVETRTLLLSVEAGRPGVLLKTLVEPGTHVAVGMPIGVIADRDEPVDDLETLLTDLGVNGYVASSTAEPAPPEAERPRPTVPSHLADEPAVATDDVPEPEEEEERDRPGLAPSTTGVPVTHDRLRTTVRADRLVALAAQISSDGVPVTVEHLVLRAVAGAHRQFPELNRTHGPDDVRREDCVDIALVVGTPAGPLAPVLRDVAALSVKDLAVLVAAATDRARGGRHAGAGGSIAVSHLGRYGLDDAVPSVAPPQVASLAIGGVRDEAVVQAGAIVAGKTLTLTLSVDHDVVDDVSAARWLGVVAALLERPEWMHD